MQAVRRPLSSGKDARGIVEFDGTPPRRFAVAGVVLFLGLVFGVFLGAIFRWAPYYWQWLSYTNALVACVLIYILLPAGEKPRPVPPPDESMSLTRSALEEQSESLHWI